MTIAVSPEHEELWAVLGSRSPNERCRILRAALQCEPEGEAELNGAVGRTRALGAALWEQCTGSAVPLRLLRACANDAADIALCERISDVSSSPTRTMFATTAAALIHEIQQRTSNMRPSDATTRSAAIDVVDNAPTSIVLPTKDFA